MSDSSKPISQLFRASFLKIERAQRHLSEMERVVTDYLARYPARWSGTIEMHAEERRAEINFSFEHDAMPEEASSILGDIIHNLRSSLDLMASELCVLRQESPKDVYFPFCDDPDYLPTMIAKKHFDRAGPDAVKLLTELKPYKGGNIALRAIHDLDVQDKHQRLIVNQVSSSGPILDMRPPSGPPVFVTNPNAPSGITLRFPADCALAEEELIPTLHKLVETTTAIIERFKALVAPAG